MNSSRENPAVSVVIPNWNGATLLRRFLPILLEDLRTYGFPTECIVVDDGSTDDSVHLLQEHFADVSVVRHVGNFGFSSAVNSGIHAAKYERILLLNNDVQVMHGFLGHLQSAFDEDCHTFAVAARQEAPRADRGGVIFDGFGTVDFRDGHLIVTNVTAEVLEGRAFKMGYCSAGCGLFSREKVLALGGFCPLFNPFYAEDTELGLQALRRGWRLAFAPEARVEHIHATTTRRRPIARRLLPVRNYFFLHWLLLDSPELWSQHLRHLLRRVFIYALTFRWRYVLGLGMALLKIPEVRRYRRQREKGAVRKLSTILPSDE